jgi:hypothetical protein
LNALDSLEYVEEEIGACCLFQPVYVCIDTTETDCLNQGGDWQGPGTFCSGNIIACCLPGGGCADVDETCCGVYGGFPSPTGQPMCLGDGDGNGVDDACEAPCYAVDVRSDRDHGAAGELSLAMGVSGGIEPRQGGIQKLEIDLAAGGGGYFSGGVTVNCSASWSGTVSGVAVGDTVTVTFSTPLPDQAYCTVSLDCGAQVCVRGLEGDVDRSGLVTTGDASIVKPHFGDTPTDADAEFDFDCSGLVTTSDFSQIKPLFGNVVPNCP